MSARIGLPPPHYGIDVSGIELQSEAAPARAFSRDHAGAAAEKPIEHDVAARGAVENSVGDQSDRLDRGVQREQVALVAKGPRTRIWPYIGAIAAEPAELDVVAMSGAAVLEDED